VSRKTPRTTMTTAETAVHAAAQLHQAATRLALLYSGSEPRFVVTEHGVSIGFDTTDGVPDQQEVLLQDLALIFGTDAELHVTRALWVQQTSRGEHGGTSFFVHLDLPPVGTPGPGGGGL